jgi:hypothetical protein
MFNRHVILAGLSAVVLNVASSIACAAESNELKAVRFEDLSERTVSRLGDAALRIPSIQWEHAESAHFIFHIEKGFAVPQLAGIAEWAYARIKSDLGIKQDDFERKCHLYVFLNQEAWQEFAKSGKMDEWTGGWCTGRELFFWSRPHFKFQGSTLPHELTHLVLYRFVGGDIPLWLNEGLAEFEGIRVFRAFLKTRGYDLRGGADKLDRDRYISLRSLTNALDYPRAKEEVTAFYIESQRLVKFLYDQYGGKAPLLRLLTRLREGARFETAWNEVYSGNYREFSQFEEDFKTYLTGPKN